MVTTEGQYYYNASGGMIDERQATAISMELRARTLDGFDIYHITYRRLGSRSAYDAVQIKSYFHYITGSGFTLYDGHPNPSRWDTTTPITWMDARYHTAQDLIHIPEE